jgi:hypothetical protein
VARGLWKQNEGLPQDRVHLADIDGDGRFDYCNIDNDGNIRCWRNGGLGDMPEYWQELGVIFTGKGKGDVHGLRFADINGDVSTTRAAAFRLARLEGYHTDSPIL